MANGYIRSRNLYDPTSDKPFKLSRSKIDSYLKCPRCFYLDRRLGIGQPQGPAFTLNSAVDKLLKKEFDIHRVDGSQHPLMEAYGIKAIPFAHENMDMWRENFKGVQIHHEPTNFIITGAIDDLWINDENELIVVDYKATSTTKEITLDDKWKESYKRQMDVYQWLLRQSGFKVSDTGYFVYCNGIADKDVFDGQLEFHTQLIPYKGDDSWVEKTLINAHECLCSDNMPTCTPDCDFCNYYNAIGSITIS